MAENYEESKDTASEAGTFSVSNEKKKLTNYKSTLEELTEIIKQMREVGFGTKKGQVDNPGRVRELVDLLNANLPETVDRAINVLKKSETIVLSANKMKKDLEEEARRIDAEITKSKEDCDRNCTEAIGAAREQGRREAENIVAKAQAQAEAIVEAARKKAAQLVDENNVTIAAREEAARYLSAKKAEADGYSKSVHDEADTYSEDVRRRVEADREMAYQKLREAVSGNLQMVETAYTEMEKQIKSVFSGVSQAHQDFIDKYATKK